jgi:hypothetical protein
VKGPAQVCLLSPQSEKWKKLLTNIHYDITLDNAMSVLWQNIARHQQNIYIKCGVSENKNKHVFKK